MTDWDRNPVSPLFVVAPVAQGGADAAGHEDVDEEVIVEEHAVFGDPICGKCSDQGDELLPIHLLTVVPFSLLLQHKDLRDHVDLLDLDGSQATAPFPILNGGMARASTAARRGTLGKTAHSSISSTEKTAVLFPQTSSMLTKKTLQPVGRSPPPLSKRHKSLIKSKPILQAPDFGPSSKGLMPVALTSQMATS